MFCERILSMFSKVSRLFKKFRTLPDRLYRIQESLGRIEMRQIATMSSSLNQAEFRVFSQWGEDGIIQYLVNYVPIDRLIFVEFGVENYVESNTRFLLTNNHWAGLVLDGSQENIDYIKRDVIYWAANLKADCAFITKDNINNLLSRNGISGDIGLLSVDIDGNDYWIWNSIDVISPRIVVCEYNSHFGFEAEVTTPYDPGFVRERVHYSNIYYGASISALNSLATEKGYSLVAGNQIGNNVFFVRNDILGDLKVKTPKEIYRRAQFREFRDEQGQLTFDDFEIRLAKIGDLPLYDLKTCQIGKVRDLVFYNGNR